MLRSIILFFVCVYSILGAETVFAQCSANAGPDVVICINSSTTLGATTVASGGVAPYTYSWTPAIGLSCTNCPNPIASPTTTTTYTLKIYDADSTCIATDALVVTISPNPITAFSSSASNLCANLPIHFTNSSIGSNNTYQWNFGNTASGVDNFSTTVSPNHEFISTGSATETFSVTLIATNQYGCIGNTVTQTVTVKQTPGPLLTDPISDMKNCQGTDFEMMVFDGSAVNPAANYQIIWGDGSADYNSTTAPQGITHNYISQDIFDLQYIVSGTNGCIDTNFIVITNITNPAIGAANPGNTNGCGPLSICFPLNNFSSNHPTTKYRVDFGDGSPVMTLPHPPPNQICHDYVLTSCGYPGNAFTFRIKAINLCDSSEATIFPIRVSMPPIADFTPTPNPACAGSSVLMQNQSISGVVVSNCSAFSQFEWNFGDGSPVLNTNSLSNQSPSHVYSNPGTYTVSLVASNAACGSSTKTKTVCIEIPPVPKFSLNKIIGCAPYTTIATDQSTLLNTCNVTYNWTVLFNGSICSPATGNWTFANGTNASSVNPNFTFSSPGSYTITLKLTNSCGSFSFLKTVTVQSPPEVSIANLTPICKGNSISPTAVVSDCYESVDTYAWTFPSGSPSSSSNPVPGTISYATAGTFNVNLSVTNSCGTVTDTKTIVVNPSPLPVNPMSNSPVCEGSTLLFSVTNVAGNTYSWTGPGGFTSSLESPSIPNATPANSGTYSVVVSNNGCSRPAQNVSVTVNPFPAVSAGSSFSVCENGVSVALTGTPAGGTWSGTGVTGNSFNPSGLAPTDYTLSYTYTAAVTLCSKTVTILATVKPRPIVDAGLDLNLCNQPVPNVLSGSPSGGTWTGTGITNPSGVFTPTTIGNFPITYSFTAANGCSNTDQAIVHVINPTVSNAGTDSSVCLNSADIVFSGLPSGGTWTGTGVSSTGVFTPSTVGTFKIVYTFGSGTCLTTDTLKVIVKPLPTVNAGIDQSICINAPAIQLTGTPVGGTWTGTGLITSTGIFNPIIAGIGATTLTYSYTDPVTKCFNTDTKIITVNPSPNAQAGADLFLCNQPIPENLTGTPSGGTWTGTGITNPSGVFLPSTNGTFQIIYTVSNSFSCSDKDTIQITVGNASLSNAGNDTSVCIDAPNVQLNGLPGGGTWTGSSVTNTGIFDPTVVGDFQAIYSIGSGTCVSKDTLLIHVLPLPIVNAGADFQICLNASPSNLIGTPSGGTWSGTGVIGNSFSPIIAGVGTVILTYTFTDPITHCVNFDTRDVLVNPLPTPSAGNDTVLCNQPVPVQLQGLPIGGTWSGTSVTAGGLFTPSGTGNFTLTYTYTLPTGCSATDQKSISIVDAALASAGPDLESCFEDANTQLTMSPAGGTWTGLHVSSVGVFQSVQDGVFDLVYTYGAGSCLTRDTMKFTVHALPVINLGIDQEFCISEDAVNLVPNPTGGTWAGTGITNTTLGTFNPTIAGLGSHEIIYTYQEPVTTCVNKDTLNILVNPLPDVQFTYNPIACIGTAETFTNTSTFGNTFTWNFGDGSTSALENPSHTYTNTGNFDIQLIVTTLKGCKDSLQHGIELREPATPNFSLTPDSSCAPVLVDFTNSSTGIGLTYAWDFGNGQTSTAISPTTQTFVQGVLADTTYYIELAVTNFCGTTFHYDSVIAMPKPKSVFGTNLDVGCSPFTLEIANNSLGLPDTYYWDFGDGTTSTNPAALLDHVFTTGAEDTVYTIMLVVTNECGTDTSYHDITVLPNQVNAFFNTDITSGCEDLTVNFTQFSTGANSSSWDFGDGNTSTVFSPTHTFTNPGNYEIHLFVNDGCSFDTSTISVSVFPSPIVNFSFAPDSVCINELFQFTNNSQNLSSSSWTFGDGGTSILSNPTHAYTASGIFPVTLTGTSAINGCPANITKNVLVSLQPSAAFVANPISGCVSLPVNFTQTGSNVSFQTWNFGDGNSSTNINPQHTFTLAGTYAVKHLVENSNGCKDSSFQIITVYPIPNAEFSLNSTDPCFAPVTVNTTNLSTGATNYQWNLGNGTTSNLTNETIVYTTPGTYVISLTASNTYGCTDSYTLPFTVYPTPVASFTVSKQIICEGETVIFSSQSTFADSLVWDMGDGTILYGNQVSYAYNTPGNFPIVLTIYGAGGCTDISVLNPGIQVNPTPVAGFSYFNVQNEDPLSGTVEFTNTSQNATAYNWHFGNGNSSTEVNPIERYNKYGTFQVTLIASNQFGCSDTIIQLISVDFFSGLFVPNAMYPGHPDFGVSHFLPIGVGVETYELTIYDDWGNLIWKSTSLDSDGRPNEAWDGRYKGEMVKEDAYVWKVNATFLDTKAWRGKEYVNGKFKRSGTVTVIR